MRHLCLSLAFWLLVAGVGLGGVASGAAPSSDRTALAVEALKKLDGVNLEENAALKAALLRVLEAVRGTSDFVELVRKFQLTGQEEELISIARTHPDDGLGVDAIRLLLDQGGEESIRSALEGADPEGGVPLVQVLGNSHSGQTLSVLKPLLTETNAALPVRREAVRSIAKQEPGARTLLELAAGDALPRELSLAASEALSQVRWPELRAEAARVLPRPLGRGARPLPPLSELLAREGDATQGKEVFFREETGCATCHQVQGAGREIGPNLSEVGSKLGKEGLYDAILNPSAGISFGYEAWSLELADGEEAYGLIVSETLDTVFVKDTQGIVTQHQRADVLGRRRMALSLMPADLQVTMTPEDLVNLVEFLASLKKED